MTVKELINELEQYDGNLPICIDDYMGFVEATEKTIKVEHKKYITFPFSDGDEFNYINLKSQKFDY
jgi:hypothetical protein